MFLCFPIPLELCYGFVAHCTSNLEFTQDGPAVLINLDLNNFIMDAELVYISYIG